MYIGVQLDTEISKEAGSEETARANDDGCRQVDVQSLIGTTGVAFGVYWVTG